jgi:hypothetical protein
MSGSSCNINIVISDSEIVYSALTLENVSSMFFEFEVKITYIGFFSSLYFAAILYTPQEVQVISINIET